MNNNNIHENDNKKVNIIKTLMNKKKKVTS